MVAVRSRLLPVSAVVVLAAAAGAGLSWLSTNDTPPPPRAASPAGAGTATVASPAAQPFAPRSADAATRGCWTAPAGSRFRFALTDRVEVTLGSAEGGNQPGGTLHTACEVVTTVLDRRAGETLVRQQIEGLQCLGADGQPITGDAIQESFVAACREAVLVRLDATGRMLGFGFVGDLDGDQRNFLRGTLGLFGFQAPGSDALAWTSEGQDNTGTFVARHERLPAADADELAIRRTRTHYTRIVGQPELPAHELSGAAEASFALDRGWLVAVRLDETMRLTLPLLDLRAITTRRASVKLLAADHVPVDGDLAAAWSRAIAGPTGDGERTGGFASGSEQRLWRQRLQDVTLDQLLAELQRLLQAQPVDNEKLDGVFQKLQWLLRFDDRAVDALAAQVAMRQVDDGVAHVAIGSFGAAGTAAAQGALTALRSDPAVAPALREAATISCLQVGAPTSALVEGLFHDAGGESALRGQSLLVLGALAPRAGTPLADGRTPLQALLAMEATAASRGELDTWLMAVANAAAPETFAIAMRLFEHASAAVRGACCVAIRSVPTAAALEALLERGLADADPQVRHEALLALARRPEPAARAAIEATAAQDQDLGVRDRATRLLQKGS